MTTKKTFEYVTKLAILAQKIEQKYDYPQYIEWAIKDGVIYVLQTRPITNISLEQWRGIKLITTELKDRAKFFYQQTQTVETFSCPRPLAYSILEKLCEKDGPIELVYKSLEVSYQSNNQFKMWANELYIDKQIEIKTIFLALGYLQHEDVRPQLESLKGLLTTVHNWLRLLFLSDTSYEKTVRGASYLTARISGV